MSRLIAYLPQAFKAIVAAATAGSGSYAGAVDGGVTAEEWAVVVVAAVAAGFAVWRARNKPAPEVA
jgi:hypothetical protein